MIGTEAVRTFDLAWLDSVGAKRDDLPFWEAWTQGRFLLHRCGTCGRHYWPASCCVRHGFGAMEWVEASGRGRIHSWTLFHRHYSPLDTMPLPYNVCVIRLDESPFFHSRVVDCPPDQLRSGLEVVLKTPEPGELPLFRRDFGDLQ